MFGTVVFAMFAGFYFWWPKMTGKMLDERLGKIHFWTLFVGFHMTFLIQHWLGVEGMPRRYVDYLPSDGFTIAEHGLDDRLVPARGLDAAVPLQRLEDARTGPKVTIDDPWGYGRSLEWATSCPPPRHNFLELPRIRSESPGVRPALPARRRAGPRRPRARTCSTRSTASLTSAGGTEGQR